MSRRDWILLTPIVIFMVVRIVADVVAICLALGVIR